MLSEKNSEEKSQTSEALVPLIDLFAVLALVFMLDSDATMPLDVEIENMPKFKGIPGLLKGNRALKITESLFES